MTEKRDKVNVEDIIGLIKTDEPTNSVEEVRKLRGRDDNNFYWYKKYKEVLNENEQLKDALNQRTEQCDKLYEENQALKDKYERKDRQLKRTKKDIEKYTDYFMNELNWDCDRIIKEVFR